MKIKRLLILLIAVAAVTFAGCGSNNSGISKTGFFLDTVCSVTVYGIDETNQYFDYGDKKEKFSVANYKAVDLPAHNRCI